MLFELRMPNPVGSSVYQQHRYVDMMLWRLRTTGWQKRDYIWCESDGVLFVRRAQPTNDLQWQVVQPPKQDSQVTLQVVARCRMNTNEEVVYGLEQRNKGSRPTFHDTFDALGWIERIGENNGFHVEDADTEMVERVVVMPTRLERIDFILKLISFAAVVTVTDHERFERTLARGIGDSKAYGCGYIHFWERET